MKEWIGVDLDGTLAEYHGWRGVSHIGPPIQPMLSRVKRWIGNGHTVKIFTARANEGPEGISYVKNWLELNGLPKLEVTATKDYGMTELWDDRCIQMVTNEGITLEESLTVGDPMRPTLGRGDR